MNIKQLPCGHPTEFDDVQSANVAGRTKTGKRTIFVVPLCPTCFDDARKQPYFLHSIVEERGWIKGAFFIDEVYPH